MSPETEIRKPRKIWLNQSLFFKGLHNSSFSHTQDCNIYYLTNKFVAPKEVLVFVSILQKFIITQMILLLIIAIVDPFLIPKCFSVELHTPQLYLLFLLQR